MSKTEEKEKPKMMLSKKGHFKIHGSSGIFTVPASLVRRKEFRKSFKNGYKVLVEFLGDRLVIKPLPRFDHINVGETSATIFDNKLGREINVYFGEKVLWCDEDHISRCEHTKFVAELPETQKAYAKKGLKVPETK